MKKDQSLVFLCGARDFHAMDWYKSAKEMVTDKEVLILTDLIAGEGFKKIVNEKDKVYPLLILDSFLFKSQSSIGDRWRNILKLFVLPLQVLLVKRFNKKHPGAIYHAHSMYYLWLAWLAGIPFVGTPQGSDILVKPYKFRLFKYLSVKAMQAAKAITVDSEKMKNGVRDLSGKEAFIFQNGIDLNTINEFLSKTSVTMRTRILSIRGFTELYRIHLIVAARNNLRIKRPLSFIYPFADKTYFESVKLGASDENIGSLSRMEMYRILIQSQLVISIPSSDSSPRSVYEAIFCGAAVAITYHPYYDVLPDCMKQRIMLVDLNDKNWLENAFTKSAEIVKQKYTASEEALFLFDQRASFQKMNEMFFKD